MMGNSRNSRVFSFAILLKSRKFHAREMYLFYRISQIRTESRVCGGIQVLYFIADNQLSGKLETAIQSLDNLTKVYHAFVNAKPVPGSPEVTLEHRYDSYLVPTSALDARQPAMKLHYAGISENIAGLIENILALKAAVKDVFQSTTLSFNETAFEMSRRAYVRRMLNVRKSTHLFQVLLFYQMSRFSNSLIYT